MSKKFCFVAGLHGNEPIPIFALTSRRFKVITGNNKALVKNKRFIDQDLNASFGVKNKTYESLRATELLNVLPNEELVIDFHTTSAKTDPFAIVVDTKMISLAKRTNLKHVVIMKHNIKQGHALINYRSGISIEVGSHHSEKSFNTTLQIVKFLESGKKNQDIKVFEVYDVITKKGNYENFKKTQEGFFPILAGETSYPFFGLKAKQIDS